MTVFTVNPIRRAAQKTARPMVNVLETPGAFRLEVFAPGYAKPDFNIEVEDEVLVVSGSVPAATEEQDEPTYLRRDFRPMPFERRFELPDHIDTEAIEATYEQGILRIELPLRKEVAPAKRRIEIG